MREEWSPASGASVQGAVLSRESRRAPVDLGGELWWKEGDLETAPPAVRSWSPWTSLS